MNTNCGTIISLYSRTLHHLADWGLFPKDSVPVFKYFPRSRKEIIDNLMRRAYRYDTSGDLRLRPYGIIALEATLAFFAAQDRLSAWGTAARAVVNPLKEEISAALSAHAKRIGNVRSDDMEAQDLLDEDRLNPTKPLPLAPMPGLVEFATEGEPGVRYVFDREAPPGDRMGKLLPFKRPSSRQRGARDHNIPRLENAQPA